MYCGYLWKFANIYVYIKYYTMFSECRLNFVVKWKKQKTKPRILQTGKGITELT